MAEYSGILLPVLLFMQYKLDNGVLLSRSGKIGAFVATLGTFIYTVGYSSQVNETPTLGRYIGATMRYIGVSLSCVQLYQYTKQ